MSVGTGMEIAGTRMPNETPAARYPVLPSDHSLRWTPQGNIAHDNTEGARMQGLPVDTAPRMSSYLAVASRTTLHQED
jgi:hypothetical protein